MTGVQTTLTVDVRNGGGGRTSKEMSDTLLEGPARSLGSSTVCKVPVEV